MSNYFDEASEEIQMYLSIGCTNRKHYNAIRLVKSQHNICALQRVIKNTITAKIYTDEPNNYPLLT